MTLILLAVNPSVFSCGMLGLRSSSAAKTLLCLEKGVFLHSLHQAHTARVAVFDLIATGLVSNSRHAATGGPLEGTCPVILPILS